MFDSEHDRNSVEAFVFRLEFLQRQHRYPWEKILRNFHVLVSGIAKDATVPEPLDGA